MIDYLMRSRMPMQRNEEGKPVKPYTPERVKASCLVCGKEMSFEVQIGNAKVYCSFLCMNEEKHMFVNGSNNEQANKQGSFIKKKEKTR